jgi:hypothetical protein
MADDTFETPGPGSDADEILRRARAAKEDLSGLASAVASAGRKVAGKVAIDARLRNEPVKTLAIAFGVGYVVGGGFFTPTTSRFLRIATRLWLLPAVRRELTNQQEYH